MFRFRFRSRCLYNVKVNPKPNLSQREITNGGCLDQQGLTLRTDEGQYTPCM